MTFDAKTTASRPDRSMLAVLLIGSWSVFFWLGYLIGRCEYLDKHLAPPIQVKPVIEDLFDPQPEELNLWIGASCQKRSLDL